MESAFAAGPEPMPGRSHAGALPPLTERQRALAAELRATVTTLAGEIGERSLARPEGLDRAARFLGDELARAGYEARRLPYRVGGKEVVNVEATLPGTAPGGEVVVVGAHYDSVAGTVGANDNGSGVAATLALARVFAKSRPGRTVRFLFFANEEPPYFQGEAMGSLVYARACKARKEKIAAMLSLETIGYYADRPGSQHYPAPLDRFFSSTGNFIGFASNLESRELIRRVVETFRGGAKFPSEGAALPGGIPGVGWSDHWAFWQAGYPAVMVTDTAPFRYPHYHTKDDTPDKLDYERMARVTEGLAVVVADLAGAWCSRRYSRCRTT